MKKSEKWVHYYIDNIDLSRIEWIKLNSYELSKFFQENYFDQDEFQYVNDGINSSALDTPLGLCYLSFADVYDGYNFLLGVADNNMGKKTIIAAMIFFDSYYLLSDGISTITHISSVEVNSYFRNNGIYKRMCEETIKFINPNQHVMISYESEMGKECNATKILEKALIKNGFEKEILIGNCFYSCSEFNNKFCARKNHSGTE